MMSNRKQMKHI